MRYIINIPKKIFKINNIHEFKKNELDEKWILSDDGIYKYSDNKLFKYKCKLESNIIRDNIEDTIIETSECWKNYSEEDIIPINHEILHVKKIIYKFNEKSLTSLIFEYINNNIHDFYFESNESIDNYSVKEDINSFLSLLK